MLSDSLNPVRKIRSFTMHGDDQPDSTGVFQRTFVSLLKMMGGSAFSGAIPEAFGPLNCSQCMESGLNLLLLQERTKIARSGKINIFFMIVGLDIFDRGSVAKRMVKLL